MVRRFLRALCIVAALLVTSLVVSLSWAVPGLPMLAPQVQPTASTTLPVVEEVHPESTRAAFTTFRNLCRQSRYEEASSFLELRTHEERVRGRELTQRWDAVLDQKLYLEPSELSRDKKITDEELGKIPDSSGKPVLVRLVWRGKWLFPNDIVVHIDHWYEVLDGRWLLERLPQPLLKKGPREIRWWQWLALPILMALSMLLARLVAWPIRGVLARVLRRWSATKELAKRLDRPLRVLVALTVLVALVPWLRLIEPAQHFVDRTIEALGWVVGFWGLLRVINVVVDAINASPWAEIRPSARTFLPFAGRAAAFILGFLGVVVVLSTLGYNVSSLLAGLGIGGVALALAAQKTVENVFGSLSISVDQPFRVGDTIVFDGTTGTVENIGLRSTRVRTPDRTVVTIPNGKLADLKIETLSLRDRMRSVHIVKLPVTTDLTKIQFALKSIREVLENMPSVTPDPTSVRIRQLTESAIEIEVIAYVETTDTVVFNAKHQAMIVTLREQLSAAGVELPRPAVELRMP